MKTKLDFPKTNEIRLGGYGGELIDYTVSEQLLDADTWSLLVQQFRTREDGINRGWRGEYWGKMMRGASLTYRATGNRRLYSELVHTVLDLLTTQDELGRISSYTVDTELHGWDMWSRKYIMLGLEYFLEICGNERLKRRIIKALIRHADYIVEHVGDGEGRVGIFNTAENVGGMNSASVLEPFVRLYSLTGEARYLDFATYLVDTGLCAGGNLIDLALEGRLYPHQYPETKAYEMMSCFEGLLEYYKIIGNPEHLRAVECFVDAVVRTDYTIIGCSGCWHEFFDNSSLTQTEPPKREVMQETCVTVTFIKLCAKLLTVTGNAKYAGYIERSGLNAMYGAVNNERQTMHRTQARTWLEGGRMVLVPDHGPFPFDSYSPLFQDRRGFRVGGLQLIGEGRSYGCCVCIGSAGTAIMGLFAVMLGESGVYVNLYNDCKLKSEHLGGVSVNIRANPYRPERARITVDGGKKRFVLALRLPEWADAVRVRVNGTEIRVGDAGVVMKNGYLAVDREWGMDSVELSFKAPVKMSVVNGKIAFTKGAIVLARDRRLDDITRPVAIEARDGRSVRARRTKNPAFVSNVAYEIATRDGRITLCDYAQAGKNYDDAESGITVWQEKV